MDSASTSNAATVPVIEKVENEASPMDFVLASTDDPDVVKMTIPGLDDENDAKITLSAEEVQHYIVTKFEEYYRDPNYNEMLVLRNQSTAFEEKIKQKTEEIMKLNRVFEVLYKDQVKFLRHIGVLPKVQTKSIGIHVDLAWLPDSVPGLLAEDAFKAKTLSENLSKPSSVSGSVIKPRPQAKKPAGPIECIDLTDDTEEVPATSPSASTSVSKVIPSSAMAQQHPAPLPTITVTTNISEFPPKPRLKLMAENKGIVLQWDLPPPTTNMTISGFEIFGYQEKANVKITSALWKKMGTVKPMALPMSCTLTHFIEKYKYHFAVRAVTTSASGEDRYGFFSDPASITFLPDVANKSNE